MAELITNCSDDMSYVNVHGKDVQVVICTKTGRILIPMEAVKETGFSIYRKSQYNKLFVDDTQFTKEFYLFMLDCAKTYMLKNRIAFKENEILESINNCKKMLTESHKETKNNPTSSTSSFFKDHTVRPTNSHDITVTNHFKQPTPMTVQNVNSFTDLRVTTANSRRSSTSSSDTSRRSKNFSSKENSCNIDNRKYRSSFGQDDEQRKSQKFSRSQVSSPSCKQEDKADNKISPLNHKKSPLREIKQLHSILLQKPEHNICVTCIEEKNPHIIWAQDVENAEMLFNINNKIKAELENERVVTKLELNTVYLAKYEDEWSRCKIIKFKPLTACFIDYGNPVQVTESDLRAISQDLAEIPAQAVKIILEDRYKPSEYEKLTVKILSRKDRGTYIATVVTKPTANIEPVEPKKLTPKPVSQLPSYINKIPLQCTLENGQKIMLIGEAKGKLAIRTKDSYDKLKLLEEKIKQTDFPLLSRPPQKNQVVIVYKDDKLRRGEVINIDGAKITVMLLDYYETVDVDVSQLKNITESLYKEPMTYFITPPLKGYEVGNVKALRYVSNLLKDNKTKPTVVLNGKELDLKIDNFLLSERLISLNDRMMLADMQKYEPPLGFGSYMLYACRDTDHVTLVSPDEVEKYVDEVIKTSLDDDDDKPYVPIVGEVCLGIYQGSWSRCVVIRLLSGRFEVQYIDFGNIEFLKAEQLKKITTDGKTAPVLGVPCRFVGVPQEPNIDELIKELVIDGECYDITIKRFDGSCYEIEAPVIYEKIKEYK